VKTFLLIIAALFAFERLSGGNACAEAQTGLTDILGTPTSGPAPSEQVPLGSYLPGTTRIAETPTPSPVQSSIDLIKNIFQPPAQKTSGVN
jgi:hypothetical protein